MKTARPKRMGRRPGLLERLNPNRRATTSHRAAPRRAGLRAMARLEGRRVQRMGLLPRVRRGPTVRRAPPVRTLRPQAHGARPRAMPRKPMPPMPQVRYQNPQGKGPGIVARWREGRPILKPPLGLAGARASGLLHGHQESLHLQRRPTTRPIRRETMKAKGRTTGRRPTLPRRVTDLGQPQAIHPAPSQAMGEGE